MHERGEVRAGRSDLKMNRFCLLGGRTVGGKGRSREAWEETPAMSQARDRWLGIRPGYLEAVWGRGGVDILELLWMEE